MRNKRRKQLKIVYGKDKIPFSAYVIFERPHVSCTKIIKSITVNDLNMMNYE